MKSHELGSIALKIFGIYWLMQAIMYLMQGLNFLFSDIKNIIGSNWTVEVIILILMSALYIFISYSLILQTNYVMRIIKIDENTSNTIASTGTATNYEALALLLIGLYFAVPALSRFIPQLLKIWAFRQSTPAYGMFQEAYLQKNWHYIAENMILLIIGTALILGRNQINQIWRRLRPLSDIKNEDPL